MSTVPRTSREIDGKGRTVRELLAGRKYSIDYYQREYKWQQKQVAELIEDLAGKFLESYEEGHERSAVAEYGHYFLGSIIISDKDGQKFIIDGQQRLTTLTLLLIHLHHQLEDDEQKGQIAELIFSQKYGKRSFNLDIPERTACMEALYAGQEFADADPPESIANILARYNDIEDLFPGELKGAALPYFVDWLIENVSDAAWIYGGRPTRRSGSWKRGSERNGSGPMTDQWADWLAGVLMIRPPHISSDGKSYAYSYRRALSELLLADGLK